MVILASGGVSVPVQLSTGVVVGCGYGLFALGIVLVYKASRIFNFAQCEIGAFGAFIAVSAARGLGPFPKLPLAVAILIGVVAGTLAGLASERLVIRPLFRAPRATLLVATAGLALGFASLEALILGANFGNVLPSIGKLGQFSLFGSKTDTNSYLFGWTQIVTVLALVGAALAAVAFFKTRYGEAVLAVSQDPTAAAVVGISVQRISALVWGISGFLIGLVTATIVLGLGRATNNPFSDYQRHLLHFRWAAEAALTIALLGWFFTMPLHRQQLALWRKLTRKASPPPAPTPSKQKSEAARQSAKG